MQITSNTRNDDGKVTCGGAGCVRCTGRSLRELRNLCSKSCSSRIASPCLPALAVRPIRWMYWAWSDGIPTCRRTSVVKDCRSLAGLRLGCGCSCDCMRNPGWLQIASAISCRGWHHGLACRPAHAAHDLLRLEVSGALCLSL